MKQKEPSVSDCQNTNVMLKTKKKIKKVLPAHCHNNNHSMNWRVIKILDFEPHWYRRRVSEMINIHLQDSKINKNEDTKSLHNSYINVIDKLTQL